MKIAAWHGRRPPRLGWLCSYPALILMPLLIHLGIQAQPVGGFGHAALVVASAASHAVLYGGLAVLFGGSLRPGQEALVSRLARRVEPCPTPALLAYTRRITWLWTGFAVGQLALSALLLAAAPLAAWSLFVNVLDAPLVVLTFAVEYGVRRWRFRHQPLASLADTVRAFGARAALAGGG